MLRVNLQRLVFIKENVITLTPEMLSTVTYARYKQWYFSLRGT